MNYRAYLDSDRQHYVGTAPVLFPAVLACMCVFYGQACTKQRAWMLFAALLQPAALLVDHGHFQYNGISLGLAVGAHQCCVSLPLLMPMPTHLSWRHHQRAWIVPLGLVYFDAIACGALTNFRSLFRQAGAAAAIGSGRDVLGSVLFCLSVNHKQMAMYYAPAFFCHLLGKCLQHSTLAGKVCSPLAVGPHAQIGT